MQKTAAALSARGDIEHYSCRGIRTGDTQGSSSIKFVLADDAQIRSCDITADHFDSLPSKVIAVPAVTAIGCLRP